MFHFLLKESLINEPYRTIAEATGASLHIISKTISSLKTLGFIVDLDDKNQKLVRKKELLNRWIYQYGDKLRPSLFMGSFSFLDPEKDWKKHALDTATQWGGEPAGDLLTGYLKLEIFLLYTEQTRSDLMKQLRLEPDDDGKIEIYQRFWTGEENGHQTVPSLLVYADLIYSGDPRNLQTAQRIYERVSTLSI